VTSRRTFLVTLAGGILAVPLAAETQTAGQVYRVGWIAPIPVAELISDSNPRFNIFRQEMRRRGYVEGQNLFLEVRFAEARLERISEVVGELVRLNVDVIVAVAAPTVQATQQATRKIPIVMFGVGDPVAAGFVASLAQPGGNITGLSQMSPQLSAKRLELLKEAVPGVSRVAVLWNPTNPTNAPQLGDTKAAARALGVQLHSLEVRGPQDLESAFVAATRGRAGALIALDDQFIFTQRMRIVALAAKNRLPAIYGWGTFPEAGGLMSYSPDFLDMYRQAAVFVDKILKGAKPADLPVEQPTKFELMINLKTAKVLGLTIPPSLLLRADQVSNDGRLPNITPQRTGAPDARPGR
jgi:putative ABC transport system substrate-binding protein